MRGYSYTFLFAAIVVILAALLLSLASTTLKDYQVANEEREKKQFILRTVGIETEDIDASYDKLISEFVINEAGEEISGVSAFDINLQKQARAKNANDDLEMELPIYMYNSPKGMQYVIPVVGKGLWGPIWGYLALDVDVNTVVGAIFDHKGETPGLGAEIANDDYQAQFPGKKIYTAEGDLISIEVKKGAGNLLDEYSVDGVSGGTITSKGLETMLITDLNRYKPFLDQKRSSL